MSTVTHPLPDGPAPYRVKCGHSLTPITLHSAILWRPHPTRHPEAMLRKAEPRTVDATTTSLEQILKAFSPVECAAYLKNAGYASV
jgi:hypothetical protein